MSDDKRRCESGSSSRAFKVHAEEDFIADLEAIVERDFYPDLPRLRAQQRYLDARASGGGASVAMATTPSLTPSATPAGTAADHASPAMESQQRPAVPSVGLDSYLTGNTSEDNASFQALLDESERRRRVKYAWFYQQADAMKAVKANGEEPVSADPAAAAIASSAATGASSSCGSVTSTSTSATAGLDSWSGYRVRSALMYPAADSEADSDALLVAPALPDTRRQIVHANTRFRQAPFARPSVSFGGDAAAAASFDGVFRRPGVPGRIGPDGRELSAPGRTGGLASGSSGAPSASSYLATPSPSPGVGESPLMTWGNIDGTPCRLDEASVCSPALAGSGAATPSADSGLPYFRIPAMPTVQLADRLGRQRRLARQRDAAVNDAAKAKAAAAASKGGKSPSPAAMGLSPAARRLLKRSAAPPVGFGIGDKALRASYRPSPSPSPSRRPAGSSASTRSNASLTDGLLSDA